MVDILEKLRKVLEANRSDVELLSECDREKEIRQRALQMVFFVAVLRSHWQDSDYSQVDEALEILGALSVEVGQLAGYDGDDMIRDFTLLQPIAGEVPN